MELRFALSGSVICTVESGCVPQIGSKAIIRTESYKKGIRPGSIVEFPISADFPPVYDYSEGSLIVHIDVDNLEVLKEGPPLD